MKPSVAAFAFLVALGASLTNLSASTHHDPSVGVAASVGSATISADAPQVSQALDTLFYINVNLSDLVTTDFTSSWVGYDLEIAYDPTIVEVETVTHVLCGLYAQSNSLTPHVATGCDMRNGSTATGVLERLAVRCLRDGVTLLHIAGTGDPDALYIGTDLFDFNAVSFALTLRDGSVTCDHTVDQDGDGCPDSKEPLLVPATDPNDPWHFFSVPVPALFAASNPRFDFRDSIVGATDAQAVFAYFKAAARAGTTIYEQDLNRNGIKDGIEYDRTVVGPGMSGPPDGAVTAQDAQLAFAQFRLGYHC